MPTYPLPTLACTIDDTGISAPSYTDILLSLQASFRAIYGADVDLDSDVQDGQWLGVLALGYHNTNQAQIAAFNQLSPATAKGAGLSSVVKINGIQRMVATNSSCDVTVVGQAGTPIAFGVVGDNLNLGTQWVMPALVTIPFGGAITVTAICNAPGAISMPAGALTEILTPTSGWQSVTNSVDASAGEPVELDPQLRQRQTTSTQLPAQTPAAAIFGTIANLHGVTAVSLVENVTSTTDGNGVPGHCIAFVVKGGDAQEIVNAIGEKKSPGCNTFGNVSETYTDPVTGVTYTYHFSVPSQINIKMELQITPLAGYSSAIADEIKTALASYVSALPIGDDVMWTRLFVPAQLSGFYGLAAAQSPDDGAKFELISLGVAIIPDVVGQSDIVIQWNEFAHCVVADISIAIV